MSATEITQSMLDNAFGKLKELETKEPKKVLSVKGFIEDNKALIDGLIKKGHKIEDIHEVLIEAGLPVTLSSLRSYVNSKSKSRTKRKSPVKKSVTTAVNNAEASNESSTSSVGNNMNGSFVGNN